MRRRDPNDLRRLTSIEQPCRAPLFFIGKLFSEKFLNENGLFCCAALGQVMLYVDGMNGVVQHNETIRWLYVLLGSKARLKVVRWPLTPFTSFSRFAVSTCAEDCAQASTRLRRVCRSQLCPVRRRSE